MTEKIKSISDILNSKSIIKQDVYDTTLERFNCFKKQLKHTADQVCKHLSNPKRTCVKYTDEGTFECQIQFAGDILVFNMHTNVFGFEQSHAIHQTQYVKDDLSRQFCGMIEIYNFLSDSMKYQRLNDLGYLIARIFINKDLHFFVEGKEQLGFLYQEFDNLMLNDDFIQLIIEQSILYTIDFDLWAPTFQEVREITVAEKIHHSGMLAQKTGKRIGFEFKGNAHMEG